MPRGRELLAGVVLASVGILLALVALEVGVRWMHLVPDRFWEPDPVLGARLIAGARGWWTQEDREFVVPVQINHHGLRDLERDYAKAPGMFRVLILGDSFVEAMHVPLEATFPRVLEQLLDGGRRIEVMAAGVSGYGTASELLYFEREGARYHPDLVVLAFYPGNDVKNNSPTLEDKLKPAYTTDGALQRVVGEAPRKQVHGWRALLARSAAYHYLRKVLVTQHPQLAQTLVRHGWLQRDALPAAPERDGVPVDYGVYAAPLTPEWQEAWAYTERLLDQLQSATAASGARLAIAIVSSRDQVYPQWWREVVDTYPHMRSQTWDLDAPMQRIEAWCAQRAVPCVALAGPFRERAAQDREPLHYHHDGHWTAAGHRLAASVLKEFFEQRDLVPARQQGVHDEGH
ncbi:MAG TPA: SGNH/GDSL hydrolase family protein [Candidatus Margulisiibacteriota bacterium]|nr:SGNH/GDSL hydrolase family protein [Candidatus Margulisiibacteriota bacterium]